MLLNWFWRTFGFLVFFYHFRQFKWLHTVQSLRFLLTHQTTFLLFFVCWCCFIYSSSFDTDRQCAFQHGVWFQFQSFKVSTTEYLRRSQRASILNRFSMFFTHRRNCSIKTNNEREITERVNVFIRVGDETMMELLIFLRITNKSFFLLPSLEQAQKQNEEKSFFCWYTHK